MLFEQPSAMESIERQLRNTFLTDFKLQNWQSGSLPSAGECCADDAGSDNMDTEAGSSVGSDSFVSSTTNGTPESPSASPGTPDLAPESPLSFPRGNSRDLEDVAECEGGSTASGEPTCADLQTVGTLPRAFSNGWWPDSFLEFPLDIDCTTVQEKVRGGVPHYVRNLYDGHGLDGMTPASGQEVNTKIPSVCPVPFLGCDFTALGPNLAPHVLGDTMGVQTTMSSAMTAPAMHNVNVPPVGYNPWQYASAPTVPGFANASPAPEWPQTQPQTTYLNANLQQSGHGQKLPVALPPKQKEDTYTTVMLRNLPNDYTRDMLLELLVSCGFHGHFDFIYLPFDFKKRAGLGYAFLNLVSHEVAVCTMNTLAGFCTWKVKSNKVLQVTWSTQVQGLTANVERYRNSPVMHPEVPERFKPMLFTGGIPKAFPPPTKAIAPP